ncbi:MAG TPA: ABC transporter permease, partial [Vicinamibacteria bacterium]|nr:ABC transporter permease [Vicinamibacteria bacterium]
VLILGLGIGANSALFSVVDNIFLKALPFHDADRVVRIRNYSLGPSGEERRFNVSPRYFYAIREDGEAFEEVAASLVQSMSLTGGSEAERVRAVSVSENWAPMLGIRPVLGRYFSSEEERLGRESRVVILSHGLWMRHLGGRGDVLSQSIVLGGESYSIIGVMPRPIRFPYDADLWLPGRFDRNDARSHSYNILARLEPGVSIERAQADLDRIARSIAEELQGAESIGLSVVTARDNFVQDDGEDRVALALLATVAFLLLICCVNVANLMVARFSVRQREISIRSALGARGGRQLRQFLTETLVLFVLGGASGLLLTWWVRDYLVVLIPSVLSEQLDLGRIEISGSVAAFTLAVSVVTGLLFGSLAALRVVRPDVASGLRAGGRALMGGRGRMQRALVAAEIALALVLLAGAGLMIENFRTLNSRDLGFEAERLLTFRLDLSGYAEARSRASVMAQILRRTSSVPGVASVGTTSDNPICCGDWGAILEIEGLERSPEAPPITAFHRYVTPAFFEAMGIPLLRGRLFTTEDDDRAVPSVVIDERMAEHFWPGEDPIGKRVRNVRAVEGQWREVVGVVGAVHDMGDYQDTWYLPFYSEPSARSTENVHVMVRLSADPSAVVPGLREAVREVDPNLPIFEMEMMDELYRRAIFQDRLGAVVAGLFGGFGLLLAAYGLYGVTSFLVSQRDDEIGLRIALGAQQRNVVSMVLFQSLGSVILGAAIGLVGAVALSRLLASLVAGLGPLDLLLLLEITATLVVVAVAASFVPARRAARIDPVRTFRMS